MQRQEGGEESVVLMLVLSVVAISVVFVQLARSDAGVACFGDACYRGVHEGRLYGNECKWVGGMDVSRIGEETVWITCAVSSAMRRARACLGSVMQVLASLCLAKHGE